LSLCWYALPQDGRAFMIVHDAAPMPAPAQWATGISALTIALALGQIVGPTIAGWISEGAGGLARGLVGSVVTSWAGALLASRQKPLTH